MFASQRANHFKYILRALLISNMGRDVSAPPLCGWRACLATVYPYMAEFLQPPSVTRYVIPPTSIIVRIKTDTCVLEEDAHATLDPLLRHQLWIQTADKFLQRRDMWLVGLPDADDPTPTPWILELDPQFNDDDAVAHWLGELAGAIDLFIVATSDDRDAAVAPLANEHAEKILTRDDFPCSAAHSALTSLTNDPTVSEDLEMPLKTTCYYKKPSPEQTFSATGDNFATAVSGVREQRVPTRAVAPRIADPMDDPPHGESDDAYGIPRTPPWPPHAACEVSEGAHKGARPRRAAGD